MSTRRDRAAKVISDAIWGDEFDAWSPEEVESYRIADMVLAEVDRIPDISEFPRTDGGVGAPPAQTAADPRSALQDVATVPATPPSLSTDGRTAAPPAEEKAAAVSATTTAVLPSVRPRTFLLFRTRDITGLSGTGVVAWGVLWPDGTVALRWATKHRSTVHWDSLDAVLEVHGHGGATMLHWLDGGN